MIPRMEPLMSRYILMIGLRLVLVVDSSSILSSFGPVEVSSCGSTTRSENSYSFTVANRDSLVMDSSWLTKIS